MNISDMPHILNLIGKRNLLGAVAKQFAEDRAIALAVIDNDGDVAGILPLFADDVPEVPTILSRLDSLLHDELMAAGITVDAPLWQPDVEDETEAESIN